MAGSIDLIDNFGMVGWACSDDGKSPCRLRLDVNGVPVSTFMPTDYRPDLAAAGWAEGRCSIIIRFLEPLTTSAAVSVEVWNDETGELLTRPGLRVGQTDK